MDNLVSVRQSNLVDLEDGQRYFGNVFTEEEKERLVEERPPESLVKEYEKPIFWLPTRACRFSLLRKNIQPPLVGVMIISDTTAGTESLPKEKENQPGILSERPKCLIPEENYERSKKACSPMVSTFRISG